MKQFVAQIVYKIFSSTLTSYLLLSSILLLLAYSPIIINAISTPPDLMYYGTEEYPIDFSWNQTTMRHGYNGKIQSYLNYTSALPTNGSFLKIEYVLVGQLARFFHTQPLTMFWITRLVVSLVYLSVIYFIIQYVFKSSLLKIIAYVLVLFGTGITLKFSSAEYVYVAVFDALVYQRATLATLHYQIGGICSLLALVFLTFSLMDRKFNQSLMLACLYGAVTGLINGPNIVLVVFSLPFSLVLLHYRKVLFLNKKFLHKKGLSIFLFCLCSLTPLLYVKYVMNVTWAPQNFTITEDLNPFRLNYVQYILAIGATYIWSIIGGLFAIKKKNVFLCLIVPWTFIHPLGVYLLPGIMDFNMIRFFLTQYWVGFGLLAAYGLIHAAGVIHSYIPLIRKNIIVIFFVFISLLLSYKTYIISLRHSTVCFCLKDHFSLAYPKREVMESVFFLRDNSKEDEVVLTSLYNGLLVSAFAGNRVYINWWLYLSRPPELYSIYGAQQDFYRGNYTQKQAEDFVKTQNIRYVLWSNTEKFESDNAKKDIPYSFLDIVFENGNTKLYKVKN